MKRQRGRSRRNSNQNNANRSMESNGPDVKVRGTAKQIFDKYEGLARDAASSGNRVKAENFRQHAEHYLRIVNAIEAAKEKAREEAEAKTQEEGKDDEGGENPKSRRRYPPQVRKGDADVSVESEDKEASSKSDEDSPSEDDAVEAKKPSRSRRRKAPSREEESDEDQATEAAE